MSRVQLNKFPALPASVSELIRLVPDDPAFYDHVLRLCESDPGLASEVIRLAHSVAMATHSRVGSVRQALLLVGPKTAVSHLVRGALVKVFVPHDPVVREVWERSVWTATASSQLATDVGVDPHVAQSTALLHDLGLFAMAFSDQEAFTSMLLSEPDDLTQIERERAIFGEDHTQVGARLAAAWAFPHVFRFVIRHHHDEKIEGATDEAAIARVVALADALADVSEHDVGACDRAVSRAAAAGLPFDAEDLPVLRDRLDAAARADVARLGLSPVA